jgi:hypothetical protein
MLATCSEEIDHEINRSSGKPLIAFVTLFLIYKQVNWTDGYVSSSLTRSEEPW